MPGVAEHRIFPTSRPAFRNRLLRPGLMTVAASRLARVNREASVLWQALRWVPETSALDRDAGAAESTDGPDFQLFFGAAGEQEGAIVEVVSAVESTLGR